MSADGKQNVFSMRLRWQQVMTVTGPPGPVTLVSEERGHTSYFSCKLPLVTVASFVRGPVKVASLSQEVDVKMCAE